MSSQSVGVFEVAEAVRQAGPDCRSRARAIRTIQFVVSMRADETAGGLHSPDGLAEVSLRAVDLLVAGSADVAVLAGEYRMWLDGFAAHLPNAPDFLGLWRRRRREWDVCPDESTTWLRGACRDSPIGLPLPARENLIVLAVERGVPEALGDTLATRSPSRGGIAAPAQTNPVLASMAVEGLVQLTARLEVRTRAISELVQCASHPALLPELARQLPDSMLRLAWVERELLDRINPLLHESAGAKELTNLTRRTWFETRGWSGPQMREMVEGNERLIERLDHLAAQRSSRGGQKSPPVRPSGP